MIFSRLLDLNTFGRVEHRLEYLKLAFHVLFLLLYPRSILRFSYYTSLFKSNSLLNHLSKLCPIRHSIYEMDPRMGRRSGYHHREPDVINPQAARLHGGSRSGPPRQGYGPEFGGAGPPGRLGPSGRAPQGNAYDSEDILDDEEAQAPRRPYAGGRPRHDAEEASFADARPSARGHNNSSGRPNRGYERDSEYEHSGAFSDRRTPARGSRLNHFGDGRLDHVDDDDGALGAADARPSHRNPIRQGQGDIRRARENPEDNERYGGSRRGGGGWARDRSDDDYGNPDSRPSRALVGGRGRDEEWEGQFVQCTFAKLHPRL